MGRKEKKKKKKSSYSCDDAEQQTPCSIPMVEKKNSFASLDPRPNCTVVTLPARPSQALLPQKQSPESLDECAHPVVSGTGAVATCFFLIGLLMFLVAFGSHDWLGLEKGLTISLWRRCVRNYDLNVWGCKPWKTVPEFVRAAQGFCVVGMLTYALSVIILIAYVTVQFLQRIRGVLIALCLLIFTAGCMTLMALVVMGIKGNDYLKNLKLDEREVIRYLGRSVDVLGGFYIGWSFIVAVISAFITLASFMFCMIEFVHVSDVND
ncbi:uncharacterized protein LOC118477686 [Aplysia californica]|uniref:Uncharacterized protein LOC118477686 n=1 Tax=Aplysia californica TaxID=6500 RepID=A0ABM1VTA3_APLCA|nr:uncharacterized protein LOC118477686 [Aplysia californica]